MGVQLGASCASLPSCAFNLQTCEPARTAGKWQRVSLVLQPRHHHRERDPTNTAIQLLGKLRHVFRNNSLATICCAITSVPTDPVALPCSFPGLGAAQPPATDGRSIEVTFSKLRN